MSSVTRTLFGGSNSSSSSRQQSSSQLDPRLFELFNQNYQSAQNVANNLGAREFAGYTPDYYAGADMLRNTLANGDALRTVGQGADYATRAGAYTPQNVRAPVANRGDVRDVNGGSFLNANIADYMNPYLNLVAGNTMSDMERARLIEMQQGNNAAVQANAFGGSRHGVAGAETNRNYYDRLGNTLSNLYATGFQSAAGLAQGDLERALQAATSNQSVDQQMSLANMEAALKAAMANQSAGLTANQQQLAAAEILRSLGISQQELELQGADALLNLGLGQQQFSQAQLDAIRNLPLEQQGILNEALGINPAGGSGTVSSSSGSGSSSGTSNNGIFKSLG